MRTPKAPVTTLALGERHRSKVVSIEDGVVKVQPLAQKLSAVEPIQVSILPMPFPYRLNVGCEGVLQPSADGQSFAFAPSRRDDHLEILRAPRKAAHKPMIGRDGLTEAEALQLRADLKAA